MNENYKILSHTISELFIAFQIISGICESEKFGKRGYRDFQEKEEGISGREISSY